MWIEVRIPTNVVRPPERHVSPSVGFVPVMSPVMGFLEPIRNTPLDVRMEIWGVQAKQKKSIPRRICDILSLEEEESGIFARYFMERDEQKKLGSTAPGIEPRSLVNLGHCGRLSSVG